ncbi:MULTISPECIES: hypothetical protein [Roseobacteraceae]|uniref:hypothetical protein n=1 Tax=Roseobacteraceae TaxID=2854170 RepID=UPI00125ECE6E|nr:MULTISPECIES: hypothetical protein [Roseobacteraceae]
MTILDESQKSPTSPQADAASKGCCWHHFLGGTPDLWLRGQLVHFSAADYESLVALFGTRDEFIGILRSFEKPCWLRLLSIYDILLNSGEIDPELTLAGMVNAAMRLP